MDAGEMRRERTAIDLPLFVLIGRLVGRAILLALVFSVTISERGLDIFQRELHLVAIELFGSLAKLRALQQMAQLVVLLSAGGSPRVRCRARSSTGSPAPAGASTLFGRASIDMPMIESDSRPMTAHQPPT
jgi:hypothetical protein